LIIYPIFPPLLEAILDGAHQIAVPTFVSTHSICVVFVSVFFLTGAAGSLFAPLAMAVIFAMMASYIISRMLAPTLVRFAMEREHGCARPCETIVSHRAFLHRCLTHRTRFRPDWPSTAHRRGLQTLLWRVLRAGRRRV
jgi:multidrug efflux pump subunit AcrB